MRVFFDTSAFVKRYVEEPGSDEVQALLVEAEQIVVSALCLPECLSALQRLRREDRLTTDEHGWLKDAILADLAGSEVCHLVPEVIDASVACLERHALRTLDAVHLGSALVVDPSLFVSGDRRLIEAGRSEGLAVRLV